MMRMRGILLALVTVSLLSLPGALAESEIGRGHITAGAPTTAFVPVEGVASLYFAAPAVGTVITTRTVDHGGLGYDLDMYFFTASGTYLSSCATAAAAAVCTVPGGAAEVEVSAFYGFDLDVALWAL